ncbi:MAG: chemotaxis response regulator protein-glutamate methylesterase [Gammaproteobacteria bacterium]|nr:chemotaxis response regulator protein-glutamate methylesterase [Gammaproteobacteria bacterium]MBQ0838705.1 chemotaxis response regulator protein-glutamate methylesterase [Gammaproteobacteria bacterium]
MAELRLLVVDDSAMYRQALTSIADAIPGVRCIGVACDGKEAIEKIVSEKPDVVTLDMEMPVMSGMDVIKAVTAKKLNAKLIIVSACSQSGAEVAINALKLGAYDFITKPSRLGGGGAKEDIHRQLLEKLEVLSGRPNSVLKQSPKVMPKAKNSTKAPELLGSSATEKTTVSQPTSRPNLPPKAIAMGCSTGGPKALLKLFSGLQCGLEVPIFIVQHMPTMFTKILAKSIDEISAVSVKEAEDGDKPQPNHAYIAPGGRQMKLVQCADGVEIKITDDESDNFCKPSVDYFFASVAEIYEARALAVILSGMGSDGSEGLKKMKCHGVTVIGQDEASCVVYGMPRVAKELGLVDTQVSIEEMASAIESVFQLSASRPEVHAR